MLTPLHFLLFFYSEKKSICIKVVVCFKNILVELLSVFDLPVS